MARVTSLSDCKTLAFWVGVLAELIGTLFLVLVACGACSSFPTTIVKAANGTENSEVVYNLMATDIVRISLAFGFSVATIVWMLARVSGGHINPAVTFGFLVTRKITFLRAVFYVLAQSVGALIGAAILKAVSPAGINDALGLSAPYKTVNLAQAFFIEALITFVLVWTVFATCDSQRRDLNGSGPLAIGLSIAMCHLWAVPYTGSGMNPARVFGPAAVSHKLIPGVHWLYWVGPLLGGALAAIMYDFVFAVNASRDKLKGFFTRDYDDSDYDNTGRKQTTMKSRGDDTPLKDAPQA